MSRTILPIVKSSGLLWFTGSFLLVILLFVMKEVMVYPLKSTCVAPEAFYTIDDHNHWTVARGIYHSYREGFARARIVYSGNIRNYSNGIPDIRSVAVLREVIIKAQLTRDRLHSTVIEQSRKLGDQSSDQQVLQYVFPHIKPGESNTTWLYLLNGKAIATGSETTPRTLCVN